MIYDRRSTRLKTYWSDIKSLLGGTQKHVRKFLVKVINCASRSLPHVGNSFIREKGSFSQLSQVCKVTRDKLNFSSRDLIYSAPDQIHSKFKSTLFLIKGKYLGEKRGV